MLIPEWDESFWELKHNWKIPYRELGVMMALQFFIAINHLMFFNKNSEKAEKHAIFFGKKKKIPV